MRPIEVASTVVGVAGLAGCIAGWMAEPRQFYAGWLSAFTLLAAWPLGSMALLLVHALTGGRWGEALSPALRTGVCALPVLLAATLPLAAGVPHLYAWAGPQGAHLTNAFYLNVPFFSGRGAAYLVVWVALARLVLRDRGLDRVAPAGLFVLALTSTFAAIDTTMSLDPHFVSSIYGMVAGCGMVLFALSVAVLLTAADLPREVRGDLGKLLLALVVLWIYLDFMQLLIVWQSDLSSEAPWYLMRSRGGWGALRLVIALGHFLLPFALLLRPRWQASRTVLAVVAALLVVMEVLRSWWIVLPSLGLDVGWVDVACVAALGGSSLLVALRGARRVPAGVLHHV